MKFLLSFFFILIISFSHSQGKSFEPKGSFKFDIQLPIIIGNSAMKNVMKGMVRPSIYYQHNVFKGLNVGGGAIYSLYNIDEFALKQEVRGNMHEVGGFIKLSYQKFFGEKFGFEIGAKGGYSYLFSVNDSCKANLGKAYQEGTFFVEPIIGLELKVNEAIGFNLAAGWAIYSYSFDRRFICVNEWPIGDDYKKTNTNMFNLGFGVTYYFGQSVNLNSQ